MGGGTHRYLRRVRRVPWLMVLVLVGCPQEPTPAPPPPPPPPPPTSGPAVVTPEQVTEPPRGPRPPADVDALVAQLPPFDFEDADCRVVVWYALDGRDDIPRPGSPAMVLHTVPTDEVASFGARPAPQLVVFTIRQTMAEIGSLGARASKTSRDELKRLRPWIEDNSAPYFCVQLEPPSIAGDGTAALRAWARGGQ